MKILIFIECDLLALRHEATRWPVEGKIRYDYTYLAARSRTWIAWIFICNVYFSTRNCLRCIHYVPIIKEWRSNYITMPERYLMVEVIGIVVSSSFASRYIYSMLPEPLSLSCRNSEKKAGKEVQMTIVVHVLWKYALGDWLLRAADNSPITA